ncbi:rhomboid family intramembrane serine protease [Micrococcus luteus]|uniref:rhomboid family intramembrane serine protease n=1 Tax=Micrococcus luteus TaxID=1270 RepID=UPI00344BB8CC
MSTTPSDPHGPDSADGTPPVCPRHPGRAAYVRCAVCRRPACLDCQRPGSAAGPVCVDCASGVVAGPAPTSSPAAGAAATVPARRRTGFAASPVTWILLAVTTLVYAAQWMTRDQASGVTEALWYAGLYTSPYGMEPWRMASYALVHDVSGPTHLLLNMLALWVIGRVLEPALGWWRFLALYVLSAVGGAVFALWVSDPLQPVVGASGAVYGMFAALFLLTRVRGGQVRSIAVLIGLNLAFSFLLPGVAWQVHVGGLLTGAVVAVVFSLAGGLRPGRARLPSVGAQVAGLVVVAAALAALTVLGAARATVAGLLG